MNSFSFHSPHSFLFDFNTDVKTDLKTEAFSVQLSNVSVTRRSHPSNMFAFKGASC